MLVGLPQYPKEESLGSLLVLRVLYVVIPHCFAAILLGVRETWLAIKAAAQLKNAR